MFAFFKRAKAAAMAAFIGLGTATAALVPATSYAQFADGLSTAQGEVLGYVSSTIGFIVVVGMAVLGLVMVAKAVKWARKAG
ncbi:MAG: hypothetical protein KatS3mg127_1279 [Silanimonas sp.]|jgi:hypothetical protein|nr:MAG: hypothetical protein KatS3mg127_1279 [Silanimonas sp.]